MSAAQRARCYRLDARLAKLGSGLVLFGIPPGQHAIVFVEGRLPMLLDRDDALRRMAIDGWPDHFLDHWRVQLHDQTLGGMPVFYVVLGPVGDGDAVCLAWEIPSARPRAVAGEYDWQQHVGNSN